MGGPALRGSTKRCRKDAANKPHGALKSDLPAAPEPPVSKLVPCHDHPGSLLPRAVSKSSSPTPGLLPGHVPTSQLQSRPAERGGMFPLSNWDSHGGLIPSSPSPPHSQVLKGTFPSIKGDHVWIDTTSNAHPPSAGVKGSRGLLNLTATEAFISKLKCYREVRCLGSWKPSPATFEWESDCEMRVPLHSDGEYSQFYM